MWTASIREHHNQSHSGSTRGISEDYEQTRGESARYPDSPHRLPIVSSGNQTGSPIRVLTNSIVQEGDVDRKTFAELMSSVESICETNERL